jgi:predicted regulator of Ras-like GTPase activity (Roadblock/LC7/MglB family)
MKLNADTVGSIGSDDVREFEDLLNGLVSAARVSCALLVDRTGRMLSAAGDLGGMDETAFASLASADFSASDQLAALLGEAEFTSLYHHGVDRSMFLADVAGTAILAVLFDTRTTLGMVRIRTRSLVPRFAACLARIMERGPSGHVVQMETGWAAEAEHEIDRLFRE